MSSADTKKRAASPTGTSPGPKRQHTTIPPEENNGISLNDGVDDSPAEMYSRAVAEFYPDVSASPPLPATDIS